MNAGQRMIPYDKEALRVVVPVTIEPAQQAKFCVLVNGRDDGLCETRRISNKLVFYFPEFTSAAKAVASRLSEWNAIVRKSATEATSSIPSQPQPSHRTASRPKDPAIPMPFTWSWANEVQFYVSTYALSRTAWLLDHITNIVDAASPDLRSRMPSSNVNLHKFLDREATFGMDEASGLVEEAKVCGISCSVDIR